MALEGSIKDFAVTDILNLIAAQKKDGVLTLSCEKETVRVVFMHGNVASAFCGDADDQLSNALIMAEKITILQLRTVMHARPKGAPIAETLLNLAYLTLEELHTWNQILTQETIISVLFWESGSYRFEAEEGVLPSHLYRPMSVEHLLTEGARQKEVWPTLLSTIPSRNIVYEVVNVSPEEGALASPDMGGEDSPMDMEEHAWLLQWIDGVRTVSSIVNHAGVGAFPVYKCLIELLAIGKIKEKQEEVKPREHLWSNISFQQIALHPFVLNGFLIAVWLAALMLFLTPSFFQERDSFFQKVDAATTQFQKLIAINQKDRLEFALHLYYLKYRQYPLTLNPLVEEALIEETDDFQKFSYRSDGEAFQIFLDVETADPPLRVGPEDPTDLQKQSAG